MRKYSSQSLSNSNPRSSQDWFEDHDIVGAKVKTIPSDRISRLIVESPVYAMDCKDDGEAEVRTD